MRYFSVIQPSLFKMIIYTHIHFEHLIVTYFDLQNILQHTFPTTHSVYIKINSKESNLVKQFKRIIR